MTLSAAQGLIALAGNLRPIFLAAPAAVQAAGLALGLVGLDESPAGSAAAP